MLLKYITILGRVIVIRFWSHLFRIILAIVVLFLWKLLRNGLIKKDLILLLRILKGLGNKSRKHCSTYRNSLVIYLIWRDFFCFTQDIYWKFKNSKIDFLRKLFRKLLKLLISVLKIVVLLVSSQLYKSDAHTWSQEWLTCFLYVMVALHGSLRKSTLISFDHCLGYLGKLLLHRGHWIKMT